MTPHKITMRNYIKDFPILRKEISDGKRLIYLDSAATSQKPQSVIKAISDYYQNSNANVHRGIYHLAEEATALYEKAREKVAAFVGVHNKNQIIFTRNTTESINLVARTWGVQNLNPGDVVLTTEMEHHSNIVPWFSLVREKKIILKFIRITDDGLIDLSNYHDLLKINPKLVTFTHMSNVLGTINPIKLIIADAHKIGAVTLVDGAQSVPHMPVDIEDIDADFYAFSGHKMCGPTGIGVLFGKKELLDNMPPFLGGGDMIKKVTFKGFSTNSVPYKFEAGTPAIAQAVGFGAAVDYLSAIGMEKVYAHEQELMKYAYETLSTIPGLTILGPSVNKRAGLISFVIEQIHPHDVAQILDQYGIAIRAGHHCAMPLHEKLKIDASSRASMYLYNTKSDIDSLKEGLIEVIKVFQ
ncbi:MAG: cysteine desulfurase [Anaerolineaceae bacterium]|nr:cysteine desulfurase [Anaerolineaceae bacterium]